MDNVVSSSKNRQLVFACRLLCAAGVLEQVDLVYLAEYHGKCCVDGCFGLLTSICSHADVVDKDHLGDRVHRARPNFSLRVLSWRARHDTDRLLKDLGFPTELPQAQFIRRGCITIRAAEVVFKDLYHEDRAESLYCLTTPLSENAQRGCTSPRALFELFDRYSVKDILRPIIPSVASRVDHRSRSLKTSMQPGTVLDVLGIDGSQ